MWIGAANSSAGREARRPALDEPPQIRWATEVKRLFDPAGVLPDGPFLREARAPASGTVPGGRDV
jgi:hypothetical protein